MTAVAVREDNLPALPDDPTGGRLVAWAQAAQAAHQLATSLSRTSFVPKVFQGNPADATAAIILGDELGLTPLVSLRSIYVISGTPAMYARTMVALAMSHGHQVWTEKSDDTEVVVCGLRRGSDHVERSSWTIARARKAGYTGNKKYDSDPQAMLYSKASAEIARKVAPDVLSGVPYSVEDLELEPAGEVPAPPPKVTRVSRPRPAPVEAPEPDLAPPGEPGTDEPVADVTDAIVMISDAQLRNVHRLLGKLGVGNDRDAGLAYLKEALGVEVSSSKELTLQQARTVIDFLMTLAGESE